MIAFAWNSVLHEYLSFILPFLNIYIYALYIEYSGLVTDHRCIQYLFPPIPLHYKMALVFL